MRVWLPAHFPPTAELENPAGGERTGGTETVLLVEDDPAVRQATKTMLTQFGYRVICADGALDALDLVEQRGAEIHLVLTDIIMPKMTGPQLVGRLREKQHALRAMLMSGYRPEEMLLDRPEPDLPCIAKPFAPLSLARRVREVLDENGSERTSANQSGTVPA
jgi:CheY-like chemotaxis protein